MSHQVLYRKYRPKDFSEVVGQEYTIKAMVNTLKSGRVAHAYLFSGPRGIGKTSVARLIAKAVNCTGKDERPCNACEICQDFNDGRFMDLIEIDAASNRGIDEIRSLRDAVRFVPTKGKYKVYIIDECHMLTKEAFNALLKTLEEPPEHAIFILATTEFDKLPATIVSRTQHYHFSRPTILEIAKKISEIAKAEKVKLDLEAAELIALASEGALRDAEGLLGQIMALEDGHITRHEVEHILGMPKRDAVRKLFSYLGAKEAKGALEVFHAMSEEGFDIQSIIKLLMRFARNAMVLKSGAGVLHSMSKDLLPEEIEFLKGEIEKWQEKELSGVLEALLEALSRMKQTPIAELPLELAIIEITQKNLRG